MISDAVLCGTWYGPAFQSEWPWRFPVTKRAQYSIDTILLPSVICTRQLAGWRNTLLVPRRWRERWNHNLPA